ncbi:hypothetical protein B0A50_07094 [Salinomyces thailandicus]|uniref:DSC E3 ubiquitin ligase complex subunit A n=1 Tax=Salinomyces thailandicus TaxID=706561 RepID=A0A4U0TNW6_9PEZI|nr:hypothetical protein B0A50_07094 [Salinomyces thailandica]
MAQDRRGIIIPLLIIGFIFFSPDPARSPASRFQERPTIEDAIAEEQRSLGVLQNSSYGDAIHSSTLNLTGLEPDRGYAWEALPRIRDRAAQQLEYALGDAGRQALEGELMDPDVSLYNNVTGFLHGQWVVSKAQEEVARPHLNLSSYAQEGRSGERHLSRFGRNITGSAGMVSIRFREREQPVHYSSAVDAYNATGIGAEMSLKDTSTGDEYELQLQGTYLPSLGQAIMTTTSEKYAGIFMLPHFALSQATFQEAKALLNDSISRTIERQKQGDTTALNPWAANVEASVANPFEHPSCELIVYLQQHEASGLPAAAVSSAFRPSALVSFLEHELRFPTGAFMPTAPEMRFSMLAFSPDCGYILESKGEPDFVPQEGRHLAGPKLEVLYRNGRHHLLVFTLALGAQIILLKRQMNEASTPSTRSRISFYSISILSLGDGFTTMTFLLISLFITGLWVNLMGTAFIAFVSVSFFGMRFIMDIWTVQAPERARRAREVAEEERQRRERLVAALERIRAERRARQATTPATTAEVPAHGDTMPNANAGADLPAAPHSDAQPVSESLPLPVTAQRPIDTGATPVFMPSDQDRLEPVAQTQTANPGTEPELRMSSFGSLYTKFYLLLLATLFISLNASSWPAGIRRVYFTSLALTYLSFWIPQIHRNVQRNCRHALNWEFVLGQSVLRLVPFAYFYGYEHNVLFAKRDYYSLTILAVWLWIQVVILGSQELVGPRWFVGKDWAPPAYDYHPVLREDEEGATMPIGFSEATASSAPTSPLVERPASLSSPTARRSSVAKESKPRGKRVFDCAICMQDLEVPVVDSGGSSDSTLTGGLLARRTYMVTPCRHIFHSNCLEGWMKYRLQCPICRETLPPL